MKRKKIYIVKASRLCMGLKMLMRFCYYCYYYYYYCFFLYIFFYFIIIRKTGVTETHGAWKVEEKVNKMYIKF